MARDTREPTVGLDRNKYYKPTYSAGNKLTRDVEVQGVFYSKDSQGIKSAIETQNGVSHKYRTVDLVTNDYIPDLKEDYFVYYNDEYWIVTNINREEIHNDSRPYKRHSVGYVISMRI